MSALSDASTPAQDGAPPSIDTQQLQQQQLANDLQAQGNGVSSNESVRKRTCRVLLHRAEDLAHNLSQRRRLLSVGHVLLVMQAKLDAARSFLAR